MAINYTSLLGLVQPVDGTEAGTWGDDVNNGITSILDVAVAGTQNITTNGTVVLTTTQATSTGTNLTSTSAQYAILLLSGARTANQTVTLPASSKTYTVINSTTGGYAQTVGGLTIANGEYCTIAYNTATSSWVKTGSSAGASSVSNIAGGSANQILYQAGTSSTSFITAPTTANTYLQWTGSGFTWVGGTGGLTSVGLSVPSFLSVGNSPLTSNGTLVVTYSGVALPVVNGGTGNTSQSGILYGNGTAAITTATSAQIVSAIGTTPVSSASSATSATSAGSAVTVTGATQLAITSAANLTTVGTISSGTWQGNRIADSYLSTNVGLLSASNSWSGLNNFGSSTPGFSPPSAPYTATIYSNAANATNGIGIVTSAYYNNQSNWDAIVNTTSQGIAYFSQASTPGGSLTGIGSITYNGSGTSFNTSSDRRLKDNIVALPAGTGLAKIEALRPRSFTWKQSGISDMGFIADELQAVVPTAVSGNPDDVREDGSIKPQGIDTSFLVVYLVQAIQEMAAEIVTLKTKVSA